MIKVKYKLIIDKLDEVFSKPSEVINFLNKKKLNKLNLYGGIQKW